MNGVLVDSNVLLDVFLDDPEWADWSERQLDELSKNHPLYLNPIIYAEVSIAFDKIETFESALSACGILMQQIPKEALFLAGKAFLLYRKSGGSKIAPLPDFFIGAHAAIEKFLLLSRDVSRYRFYFPSVEIISPIS
jgi:predicted nucleic acid-binding protein